MALRTGSDTHAVGGRDGRPATLETMTRRLLSWLVAACLVFMSPGGPTFVSVHAQARTIAEASERLDRLFDVIGRLDQHVDRSEFSAAALALELALEDPGDIAAWVRDAIAFEPYRGLLRGADGTLMSRAGNALDQAVLLATLLHDVGFDARIVTGTVPDGVAAQLVNEAVRGAQAAAEPRAEVSAIPSGVVDDLVSITGLSRRWVEQVLADLIHGPVVGDTDDYAAAVTVADALLETLVAAGVDLGADWYTERLLADAAEYAWVEYWDPGTGAWRAAHPALGALDVPVDGFVADRRFVGTVPEDLVHRVRFEAFIDRRVGDVTETVPVMAPFERPAANLNGTVVTFSSLPDTYVRSHEGSSMDVSLAFADVRLFFPIFMGAPPPGAMAFDVQGNVVPIEAASSVAAELFQSVGSDVSRAASAVGGLSFTTPATERGPAMDLERVWIALTLVAPGGEEHVEERTLYPRPRPVRSRLGPTGLVDEHSQRIADIGTEVAFMVATGAFAPSFVLHRELDAWQRSRSDVEAALRVLLGDPAAEPTGFRETKPMADVSFLRTYQYIDAGAESLAVQFRGAPNVIAIESGLTFVGPELAGFTSVDIMANERRTLAMGPGGPGPDVAGAVRIGVWETHAERIGLPYDRGLGVMSFDTVDEITHGAADGGLVVWTPEVVAGLAPVAPSSPVRAGMDRDLARGFVLVAADSTPDQEALAAWWRVDPVSGRTLGVTSDGRGSTYVEYLLAFAFGFGVAMVACLLAMIMLNAVAPVYDPDTGEMLNWELVQRGNELFPSHMRTCLSAGLGGGALFLPKHPAVIVYLLAVMNDLDNRSR
jgi:hypothetical protein